MVNGWTAWQKRVGLRGAAVIRQQAEERVNAYQVSEGSGEAAACVIRDQVIAQGGGRAEAVWASTCSVPSDDGVDQFGSARIVPDPATAAKAAAVVTDSAVGDSQRAVI